MRKKLLIVYCIIYFLGISIFETIRTGNIQMSSQPIFESIYQIMLLIPALILEKVALPYLIVLGILIVVISILLIVRITKVRRKKKEKRRMFLNNYLTEAYKKY